MMRVLIEGLRGIAHRVARTLGPAAQVPTAFDRVGNAEGAKSVTPPAPAEEASEATSTARAPDQSGVYLISRGAVRTAK
jgi:hypothetical protein